MKDWFRKFFKRVDEMADYLASLKSCSFCRAMTPTDKLVDTRYKSWYACPQCWSEIQAVVNEEV